MPTNHPLTKNYQDLVLICVTVIFAAAILLFFMFAMQSVVRDLAAALNPPSSSVSNTEFKIDSAKSILSRHGLLPQ
jgi:hypothetical protein